MEIIMQKYTSSFGNFKLGPFVAINDSRTDSQHYMDIIHNGFIPIAVIRDPQHEAFKAFPEEDDFKIKAVVIIIKYSKSYE